MRHQNSVFHDILKHVPWDAFDRLVKEHGADWRVRRLSTKDQFIALLYGQLSGASSLREIAGGLESHSARLYHVGSRPAQRSTLADANARRPAAVFSGLFAEMAGRAHLGLRRKLGEATYLIDSTGLRLSGAGSEWARFSAKVCGAKVHVIYDADAERPVYSAVTKARVNDITAAQTMPIEAGATYVFDLGYYDYAWWAMYVAPGSIHVVMGLSGCGKSTLLRHVNRLIDPTEGGVLVGRADVTAMEDKALMEFRRHAVSMVFQRFALFPHRTVFDNVGYGLNVQGVDKDQRRRRTETWIERVGLTGYEDHYPAQLSGGMQQRVGLARALATDAEVLLMDEAFSALDPLIRAEMQDVLLTLQSELNKTILFVSHDLDEALKLGGKITILKDGEIVQEDGPQNIIMRPADDYVADFVKDINRGRVVTLASIMTGYEGVNKGMELPAETVLEDASVTLAKAGLAQATVTGPDGAPVGHVTLSRIVEASQRPG